MNESTPVTSLWPSVESGSGPSVLLLHGFTGSAASWSELGPELALGHRLLMVDLPGHGQNPTPPEPALFSSAHQIAGLVEVLDRDGVERTSLLGYSMGARLALAFTIAHPERVERLVLESGSPGLEEAGARATRVRTDNELAARIERNGVDQFVREWEALPLFASQKSLPPEARERQRTLRLANRPEGLAASLRGFGQGIQPSLWADLPGLDLPVLLVVGEQDKKYARIARDMSARLPTAWTVIVPGAGHTPHLEQPELFLDVVVGFLTEPDPEAGAR